MRELRPDIGIPRAKLTGWAVECLQPLEARGERARTARPVVRDLRFEEERRVERQALVGTRAFHVLRDPVAAAEHPALAFAVGEPEPWFPTVVVRVVERAAVAVLPGEVELRVGEIEVRLTIVLLD